MHKTTQKLFGLTLLHWQTVWPELTKFHHFGKILKGFGYLFRVDLVLGEILSLLWQLIVLLDKNCHILKWSTLNI